MLLKGPNSKRGRKLYEVESIEAFIKSCEYRPPSAKASKEASKPIRAKKYRL